MRMTKFIFAVCIVILLVMFANGMYVLSSPGGTISGLRNPLTLGNGKGQTEGMDKTGRLMELESSIEKKLPVNLFVLGLDRDGTRCDVMMLLNFEPEFSKLTILSIARDTRIRMNSRYYKINALYSKGGEELVAKTVSELTGLSVHYYITMDFKGFRQIIDALGGVEFYVPFRMNYDDPTQDLHIHLKKGMQLLNGEKSEQLVRYRKGNNTKQGYLEGDIGRIKMQQDFLKALIKQKINFRYISKADELFRILQKYVKTNITLVDIAQYLGSIGKVKSDEIETFTMPGESRLIRDVWYFIYDEKRTLEVIERNFYR